MVRKVLATIAGLIAAFIAISICQLAMGLIMKPPTIEMMQNPEAMRAFIASMPPVAYLILAAAYAIGSLVGGLVAGKIAGGSSAGFIPALVIAVLLTLMGVVNFFVSAPGSPMWAIALCLLMYIPFTLIGNRLAGGKQESVATAT